MKKSVLLYLVFSLVFLFILVMLHTHMLGHVAGNSRDNYSGPFGKKTCFQCNREYCEHALNDVKLDVVYIAQNDSKSCATTCVAMIISYYEQLKDTPLDKETAWNISETDETTVYQFGNDMEGLQRIATHYGYHSKYIEHMEISNVEYLLSIGIPVMLNITVCEHPLATHAILVIGCNKKQKLFYINDPANKKNCTFTYADLEGQWSAHLSAPRGHSHHSGFVVYPKNME